MSRRPNRPLEKRDLVLVGVPPMVESAIERASASEGAREPPDERKGGVAIHCGLREFGEVSTLRLQSEKYGARTERDTTSSPPWAPASGSATVVLGWMGDTCCQTDKVADESTLSLPSVFLCTTEKVRSTGPLAGVLTVAVSPNAMTLASLRCE